MGAPITEVGSDFDNASLLDVESSIDWEVRYEQLQRDNIRREEMLIDSPFLHPWWSPYCGVGPLPRCLDERLIMEISGSIRSKPDWKGKYKDKEIVKKWKLEIKESYKDKTRYMDEILEYVFKELTWYEKLEIEFMGSEFKIGFNDYISASDTAITPDIKEALKKRVSKLVECDTLEYHSGFHKVIDLVDPSVLPLQYDKTPIINNNMIEIIKFKEDIQYAKYQVPLHGISQKFQWIPSILTLKEGRFTFNSYINNLHPVKFKELYNSIENVFNAIIPGLNYTLTRYASKEFLRIQVPEIENVYLEEYQTKLRRLYDKLESSNDESIIRQLRELLEQKSKYVVDVKPNWKEPPKFNNIIDISSFGSLKVIVKLTNIQLNPENPTFNGGSWQIEGKINEDIIATALYYYDIENISKSMLSFRTGFEAPQGDSFYLQHFYGIDNEDLMVKHLGSIEAKQDRIIIYPNMYQHHLDAFELRDKSKPGHLKILCFYITDPYNHNVVASNKVPPQQQDWWNDPELNYLYPDNIKEQVLQLKDRNPWPMSLKEAKVARSELIDERTEPPTFYHYENIQITHDI